MTGTEKTKKSCFLLEHYHPLLYWCVQQHHFPHYYSFAQTCDQNRFFFFQCQNEYEIVFMHIGAISWATAQLTVATTAADIVDNRFLVGFTLCVCDFSQIECRLLFFCRFNDSAVQFFTLATSIFIVQPSLIYCSFSPHSLTTIKARQGDRRVPMRRNVFSMRKWKIFGQRYLR